MSNAERMSSVDTTWLRMDRPANPMVIVGLLILKGPLDLDKVETAIAARFLAIPRFKQHVEMRAGEYWWVDDPYFDETRHIKRARLPGKGNQAELQRYVAQLASDQLDKSRPLWQLHIVEDYQEGAAIIVRLHHAIGDGMALVGLMLSIIDGGDMHVWTANTKTEPLRGRLCRGSGRCRKASA